MIAPEDDDIDRWHECGACGQGVRAEEGYFEWPNWFHPECAGVVRCSWCGGWDEPGQLVKHDDEDLYHPECVKEMKVMKT